MSNQGRNCKPQCERPRDPLSPPHKKAQNTSQNYPWPTVTYSSKPHVTLTVHLTRQIGRHEQLNPLKAIPNSLRNNGSVSTMRCSLTLRDQLLSLTRSDLQGQIRLLFLFRFWFMLRLRSTRNFISALASDQAERHAAQLHELAGTQTFRCSTYTTR